MQAGVAESVDAMASGVIGRKPMRVRLSPPALNNKNPVLRARIALFGRIMLRLF